MRAFKNKEHKEQIQVDIVRAFTRNGLGGNKAGVVLKAESLSDQEKQNIAYQIGLSETAFIQTSNKATFKVDFYTPKRKIPFCGHATIAVWSDLFKKGIIKSPGIYDQELTSTVLKITVFPDGNVVMDQSLPVWKRKFQIDEIVSLFGFPSEWISQTRFIPQIVNTGLNDLLIPIDSRSHLFQIQINDNIVSLFQKKHDLDSLHFFTFDTIDKTAITNSRNIDPKDNIHEESATGSAHGALASYLFRYGKVSLDQAEKGIFFEQGDSMGQPSLINAILNFDDLNNITRVRVGGYGII